MCGDSALIVPNFACMECSQSLRSQKRLVLALDINATIMEGDSYTKEGTKSGGADFKITEPAETVLKAMTRDRLEMDGQAINMKPRIVLYTFGKDFKKAIESIASLGIEEPPPCNYLFIARKADSQEIFAFPMHESHTSGYIDWTQKNPAIRETGVDGCLQKLSEIPVWQSTRTVACERRVNVDAYRFMDDRAFQVFVDLLLDRGNVVFRACYDPQNELFRSRTDAQQRKGLCKVLSCSSHMIVFDDHPDDWELVDKNGLKVVHEAASDVARIVRVVSPGNACANDKETNLLAELSNFIGAACAKDNDTVSDEKVRGIMKDLSLTRDKRDFTFRHLMTLICCHSAPFAFRLCS